MILLRHYTTAIPDAIIRCLLAGSAFLAVLISYGRSEDAGAMLDKLLHRKRI